MATEGAHANGADGGDDASIVSGTVTIGDQTLGTGNEEHAGNQVSDDVKNTILMPKHDPVPQTDLQPITTASHVSAAQTQIIRHPTAACLTNSANDAHLMRPDNALAQNQPDLPQATSPMHGDDFMSDVLRACIQQPTRPQELKSDGEVMDEDP